MRVRRAIYLFIIIVLSQVIHTSFMVYKVLSQVIHTTVGFPGRKMRIRTGGSFLGTSGGGGGGGGGSKTVNELVFNVTSKWRHNNNQRGQLPLSPPAK